MTSEELLNIAIEHRDNGIPLSITRYGDGEAMVLNGFNDIDSMEYVFKRQLGESPSISEAREIRNNLMYAYNHSDYIGIKLKIREGLGKYWIEGYDILKKNVNLIHGVDHPSIDFHTDWLVDGSFDKLLKGIPKLVYISCRDITEELKSTFDIDSVHAYHISPEMKFSDGYDGPKHYPDHFKHIYRWIQNIEYLRGSVALVGAGVVGKIYTTWLKEAGCIAIDIGSVFDLWAGKATRGDSKGINAEDLTYKLWRK